MSVAVLGVLRQILNFYQILIVVYVLMSWFPTRGILFDIFSVLGTVVEPYLGIFRRFIPPMGGLDFSPLVAILVIEVVIYAL